MLLVMLPQLGLLLCHDCTFFWNSLGCGQSYSSGLHNYLLLDGRKGPVIPADVVVTSMGQVTSFSMTLHSFDTPITGFYGTWWTLNWAVYQAPLGWFL